MRDITDPRIFPYVMPYFKAELQRCLELLNEGKVEEASSIVSVLLGIDPKNPRLLFLAADISVRQQKWGYAIAFASQCVSMEPTLAEGWMLLGSSLRMENRISECRFALKKALELNPQDPYQVYINLASIGADSGEPDEALVWLEHAKNSVSVDQHNRDYLWNKALAHLSLGQWEEGWKLYEFRRTFESPDQKGQKWYPRNKIPAPYVDCLQDIENSKSIYVHGEQGLGDEVMFLSCLDDLWRYSQAVIDIEVEARLVPAVKHSFPFLRNVFDSQDSAMTMVDQGLQYSYKVPLGSLPGYFRTRDEDFPGSPYLKAREDLVDYYRDALRDVTRKGERIIGLAWLGGTKITRQHERSIPLAKLFPIMIGNAVVNLQYGEAGRAASDEIGLIHFDGASNGNDIEGQLALIEACDVVVTVAQTLYHLCGSIGKRCILLASEGVDWRIGVKFGDKIPWYSSVTVIRQGKEEDWEPVAERCFDLLTERI